ncbi:MAG: hypothetical protein DSZ28_00745 [Thiothrix sp.]|nr:MAG: hypothetical protein DSZ28_00745 [Thiothrix sp.]
MSFLLLLGGDVEANPGPGNGEQTTHGTPKDSETVNLMLDELNANWEVRLNNVIVSTQKQFQNHEREEERMWELLKETKEQSKQNYQRIKQMNEEWKQETSCMRAHLNNLYSELQTKSQNLGAEVESLEYTIRRNGIRLLGVQEQDRESYWTCVQTVLHLFRRSVPGVPWTEKDIIRVQRLGPPHGTGTQKPRPILVEVATFLDKLTLLKYGRDPLRRIGIKVSGELTNRQARTLKELRQQGHNAYVRNNKIYFRGDTREQSHAWRQDHSKRAAETGTWRSASQDVRRHGQEFASTGQSVESNCLHTAATCPSSAPVPEEHHPLDTRDHDMTMYRDVLLSSQHRYGRPTHETTSSGRDTAGGSTGFPDACPGGNGGTCRRSTETRMQRHRRSGGTTPRKTSPHQHRAPRSAPPRFYVSPAKEAQTQRSPSPSPRNTSTRPDEPKSSHRKCAEHATRPKETSQKSILEWLQSSGTNPVADCRSDDRRDKGNSPKGSPPHTDNEEHIEEPSEDSGDEDFQSVVGDDSRGATSVAPDRPSRWHGRLRSTLYSPQKIDKNAPRI